MTHAPSEPSAPPAVPRRGAWDVGRERLRTAATTEPGRLQIIGAVLAALVVVFGAVAAYEVTDRSSAADDVVNRSQPLSADAASIYRSLADADTTAANGFLAGATEPPEITARYDRDIAQAAELLVKAAATTEGSSESGRQITALNAQLPRYTGLIERARANNRQGLPLGGAYLRYANQVMSKELLPAAEKLYAAETARLERDYDATRAWPFLSVAAGLLALAALGWAQRRNYRRTNRVFNHGMLAATAATTVVLLWLAVGHTVARADLRDAKVHGQESLDVLNKARIDSLKARANENLTLVARGAVLTKDGDDLYETQYTKGMASLVEGLAQAKGRADDSAGRDPVASATSGVARWKALHTDARATDDAGNYDGALELVTGAKKSTGSAFATVDAALADAIAHEQKEFTRAAEDGRGAFGGLSIGAAILAVLGAVGAILGINRRLSEYR